ncbi:MAG TPA: hypothetical protein VIN56_06385 [Candidatus Dormibacteraeota bacterium]|jgi:hypothetical protein
MARHGWFGIALLLAAWAVSWSHVRPWSDEGFFPLWLGYIITVDALVRPRLGRSLLAAGGVAVARLFATSAAMWWLFEVFNLRTDNWHYLHASPVSPVRFALEATVSFSTVLPALFLTAALWHTILPGSAGLPRETPRLPAPLALAAATLGLVFLILPMLQPHYFFPLIWVCVFFLADPLNARLGRPSLLAWAREGHWRPVLVLALAGLTCGFFWEMWNSLSLPKWTYSVPLIPQQRLFEMPYLGYSGYIPFAFECFAIYTLASTLWRRQASPVSWL